MKTIATLLNELRKAESAVTSVEYALLGALIAVVIVGAVTIVGTELGALYTGVAALISAL